MPRRLLITSALPYVNGDIHIGHLVEHVQTDVLVRFQRLQGHQVLAICGADTHGTATMIAARKEGVTESAIIERQRQRHIADFAAFGVAYDHYGSTDSPDNRHLVNQVWAALRRGGHIVERAVEQLYDPVAGTFLADRFIKGTCPRCGAVDQYGDACERCMATYAPTDLKDPRSVLSGATPVVKSSPHWFVRLEDFRAFLDAWTQQSGAVSPALVRWIRGAFLIDGQPLRDWDVSRPAPYFGFEIPDAPGHYFYVWLDAPVGYVAATKEWCDQHGQDWKRWWQDADCEIHHNIGKDITYFHTLFWPAMLKAAGFNLPTRVHIHGWLTVDGAKMSKSRGTMVSPRTYVDAGLDVQALRYYLASKLGGTADDLDLNLVEFADKVNADLIGKVVNLASRTARFVPRLTATYPDDGGLFAQAAAQWPAIAGHYEQLDTAAVTRLVMALADRANEYVETHAPWALKKDPARAEELAQVCTVSLNLFYQIVVYLAPILPRLAEQAGALLGRPVTSFAVATEPVLDRVLPPFQHLMTRVDPLAVARMIELSKPPPPADPPAQAAPIMTTSTDPTPPADDGAALAAEPIAPTITYDDFTRLDLRVARVVAAEDVPGAKKILKLTLSLGGDARRTVYAGIKSAYLPAALTGRLIVVVANLSPKAMSFGTSEGMALAAGPGGAEIFLLAPDSGAKPGQRIH